MKHFISFQAVRLGDRSCLKEVLDYIRLLFAGLSVLQLPCSIKGYSSPQILSSYITEKFSSICRKVFIACCESTPAALSLCLPEATWSVLMKPSKHPAYSVTFRLVSHALGGFQDVVLSCRTLPSTTPTPYECLTLHCRQTLVLVVFRM